MIEEIRRVHQIDIEMSTKDHSYINIECTVTEIIDPKSNVIRYPFCVTAFKINNHLGGNMTIPVNIPSIEETLLDALLAFDKTYTPIINDMFNKEQENYKGR